MQFGAIENNVSVKNETVQQSKFEMPSLDDFNSVVSDLAERESNLITQLCHYLKNKDAEKSKAIALEALKAKNLRKLLYTISCVQPFSQNNQNFSKVSKQFFK